MKATLQTLYDGPGWTGRLFRTALFLFDVLTIAYFVLTANMQIEGSLVALDIGIGLVVVADLTARFLICEDRVRFFASVTTLADLVLVVSLLAPLVTGGNLGFLRALRMLRLVRSFHLVTWINRLLAGTSVNARIVDAAANLVAFVFVVTSMVWVWEHERNPDLDTYVDALYFTVTTLTTTGYGDITLSDRAGRLLTIAIMVFGVGFFLQLLQAIYRPSKVEQPCRRCGLRLHDKDASHCKHCGSVIYIETEGDI
ncbi:voltage-gated potassium channel [Tranquillimonas rosea]|uniref:Voltage-gated potassium channel n=1 Tax=Tranquillimonas rosea TaxID=641238 RepID=A0A1H9SPW3_9RHOB|nr:potassium channel family protein [Tranquillimonas rosea]SER86379.1 voltage-gated potassium channel [Tranquillimonas rosea]